MCSRRTRSLFLHGSARLGLRIHKGDVKCVFLQGLSDDRTILYEPVPELRTRMRMRLKHDECVRLVKSVYDLGEAPRKWWIRI